MSDYNMTLSEQLTRNSIRDSVAKRKAFNISQGVLADRMGKTVQAVSAFEKSFYLDERKKELIKLYQETVESIIDERTTYNAE